MPKQPDEDRIVKAVLDAFAAPMDALEKRIAAIEARPAPVNGKDGVGIADSITDRDGVLILTLTDGRSLKTGVTAGKDGAPGKDGEPGTDGKDADPETISKLVKAEVGAQLTEAVSQIETIKGDPGEPGQKGDPGKDGKDGAPGKDGLNGKDGFGFEDLEEEIADDGRIVIRRYKKGSEVKEFRHKLPMVLDRGVYKEGQSYERGDGVTWAGSFWIAQAPTDTKPGQSDAWRLAVKRGRDGKDGEKGEKGDPGKDAK